MFEKISVDASVAKSRCTKRDAIMQRVCEHLEHYTKNFSNEWVGIFLQGSQNYGLDYEGSDVDTKIIVLPKFEDIVLNRSPISTTSILPNNEHLDVKDIRLMFNCFRKQNINFLEILFTDYFILNPIYEDQFRTVLDFREEIARYDYQAAANCMQGTILSKRKLLTKDTPAAHDVIVKYGYDGKQLHHMERVLEFFHKFRDGLPYEDCLASSQREYLISLKKHEMSTEKAVQRADEIVQEIERDVLAFLKECTVRKNDYLDDVLEDVLKSILKKCILREISEEEKSDSPYVWGHVCK